MKKICLIFALFAMSFSLFAVNDDSLLQSDETQQYYKRKAVIALKSAGYPSGLTNINENAAQIIYEWSITNRFDKIIIDGSQAVMLTKESEINLDLGRSVPKFSAGSSDKATFEKNLEKYLNSDFKEAFSELLDASVESRYLELPEKEQETFITTKAKELGISSEFVETLLDSAYIFALYFDQLNAEKMKATMYIYHYNFQKGKFEYYKRIDAKPDGFGEGYSINEGLKTLGLEFSRKLKTDDNFAIFMPIKTVSQLGRKIETDFGIMEDIRIDHPFSIHQMVDGKMERKGWVRARKVAYNCDEKSEETTVLRSVSGSAEEGDLLREYPWTGIFLNIGFGTNATLAHSKNPSTKYIPDLDLDPHLGDALIAPDVHAGVLMDLGYLANVEALSEFYFGIFGDFNYAVAAIHKSKYYKNAYWVGGGLSVSKRFHATFAGLFFAPGLDFSIRVHPYMQDKNNETLKKFSDTLMQFVFTPNAQVGFSMTPAFDLIIKAGYNFGIMGAVQGHVEGEGKNAEVKDAKLNFNRYKPFVHGIYLSLDFNIHIPPITSASKFFNSSSACGVKNKIDRKHDNNKDDKKDNANKFNEDGE